MKIEKADKLIAWFKEVGKENIALAGGKGANLGELTKAQIPVPPGFIVTSEAYYLFMDEANLSDQLRSLMDGLDVGDSSRLTEVADKAKEIIVQAPMPSTLAEQVRKAYRKLGGGQVAVRSSATAEDLPEASFAGQQRTFLNVSGEDEVLKAVQGCWASLFEARAIFYRVHHGFDWLKVGIAVPVQRMVQSEVSGVMLTVEPVSSDPSRIVIEAIYGLGEAIVSGEINPDLYIVDKRELKLLDKRVARQEWQLVRNPRTSRVLDETNIKVSVFPAYQSEQKLADDDILELASIGKRIEELYGSHQDIEWAREQGQIYVVQARPVTTLKAKVADGEESLVESWALSLLAGMPASPGAAAGPVRIVRRASEIDRVKQGDVLVAEMTTPDFVPALKRAAAIITDRGGRTCHAAIVSRELGVPCVVGTNNATQVLRDEQVLTVDGSAGKVYQGRVVKEKVVVCQVRRPKIATTTKLYVNLAEPELAEVVAGHDVDGVGLLRAEFMVAHIGEHPRYMLSQGRGAEFTSRLAQGLSTFARAFHPRPVVYRATDFKTNEYKNLIGGAEFETDEENPMLGYRGCFRYVREPDVFKLEIDAIKQVRQEYNNLWLMIPFVRTVQGLADVKTMLDREGLHRSSDFKIWMMAEVPSNIILLDEFIDVGIDGISIGSNDLTQLVLGIDRDSPRLAEDFDERNEAVMRFLEQAIKTAVRRGITCSICGQAPSVYPELTEKLVAWGITSVSVSPDMIDRTREIIARAEDRAASPSWLRKVTRSPEF